MNCKRISCLVIVLFGLLLLSKDALAQSPDSRICNCFSESVSSDFMLGSKAFYGKIGISLSRDMELKPQEGQDVKLTMPALPIKQGCQSQYRLYITDQNNQVVLDTTSPNGDISYAYGSCKKTYSVVLMATGKSATGSDGNCTRRITFKVKPQCR
jgi:hypothetical protein